MSRLIHTWLAIPATIFIILIALSGSILSLETLNEAATAPKLSLGQTSVATLADKVKQGYPGAEQLTRTQNGLFLVAYSNDQGYGEDQIDPVTGLKVQAHQRSDLYNWMKSFHRSMQMGDAGRMLVAVVAFALLALSISGLLLMVRRLGGIKHFFKLAKGSTSQKLHIELSRFALVGSLVLTTTALYLSAATFSLLPEANTPDLAFPESVSSDQASLEPSFLEDGANTQALPISHLLALNEVDASELVSLEFPYADDPSSVYTLETQFGLGYIHPETGHWLDFQLHSSFYQVSQFISALHTGEGMGLWTLFIGLTSLILPIIGITGIIIWVRKRINSKAFGQADSLNLQNYVPAQEANIVILAGSEGLSTWRFAQEFSQALITAGNKVHLNKMNQVEGHYTNATHVFFMTSTYGEGQAPSSASLFLEKAKDLSLPEGCQVNVLGFGDSQFTHFIGFAKQVDVLVAEKGFKQMLPLTAIDKFCQTSLETWIENVSTCLNQSLCLKLDKKKISPFQMQLVEQSHYGDEVDAPVRILRFKAATDPETVLNPAIDEAFALSSDMPWPEFEVGDLVGIMPPGSDFVRYYSLASCDQDGMLEICVRKQVEGECSGFLHGLKEGDSIQAFIQKKASFRPAQDASSVIMIGAGTGMAPLQGFIKQNEKQVPYYLYWGGRLQNSDFIYEDNLSQALATSKLKQLRLAFSRSTKPQYVQNLLTDDAKDISKRILEGAQIMVCGSKVMADGVRTSLDKILKQEQLSVSELEQAGRYVQDVY
ncbi:putative Oxidoreductase, FAD-binding [Marinomonas sp. MED121]|uniref:PepSY domain-containing protein n=1 Tax=Marinomonas sp. MED121 TaxID=314277 RepID=UPI000069009C|nr:PepSY domain-containing protein [Marinomonas sp. MED121]EAQ65792.1 putative Oxidoreductase, FAD-binding [Marinomonas sp. MED121]